MKPLLPIILLLLSFSLHASYPEHSIKDKSAKELYTILHEASMQGSSLVGEVINERSSMGGRSITTKRIKSTEKRIECKEIQVGSSDPKYYCDIRK